MEISKKNLKEAYYLPHNILAEKIVLSSILINSDIIETIISTISYEIFYFKNHQEIYKAILILYKKKTPIDIITVTTFLQDNGLLNKIGGIKILLELINQTPNFAYIEEYITLLQDKFLRRNLIRLGYKIINSAYITNIPLENIVRDFETELFNLTSKPENYKVISSAELLSTIFLELKQKSLKRSLPGLSSGFYDLDNLTQGFQKSDLIIVAGRPSMGKTAFCLNITSSIVKQYKLPILFFSLEMSKEQLMYRLLSNETQITSLDLRRGYFNKKTWVQVGKAIKTLSNLPIFIDDTPNISIQDIRWKIKKLIFEQTHIGIIIIDYLQLLQNYNTKPENRVQELSQITRTLKVIAREFKIPVIALSQLSRNVENRINKRPILSDLRESGSIEQDADLVLMLYRDKYYEKHSLSNPNDNDVAELIIAKHRNGPIGTIKLKFESKFAKFSNL